MEKKDFDELLFGDKKNPKNMKNIILGAIIVVAVLIIALLIWSFSKDSGNDSHDAHMEKMQTEQIQDRMHAEHAEHEHDLALEHDDRFEQIMKDVRNSINKDGARQDYQLSAQDSQLAGGQPQEVYMDGNAPRQDMEETQMEAPSMETPELHPEGPVKPPKHEVPTPAEVMKAKKPHPKPAPRPAPKLKLDAQGQVAAPGSYLQIGVFSKTPSQDLDKLLKKHSYRIQEVWVNDQKLTKYLVGPFKNRSEASRYKMAHPDLDFSVYYEVK